MSSIARNMRALQKIKYRVVVTMHRPHRALAFENALFTNPKEDFLGTSGQMTSPAPQPVLWLPQLSHVTKFGLDITNGFQWTTCQTLSWEPSDEQNKVQVHKQLPMRTYVWAWPGHCSPVTQGSGMDQPSYSLPPAHTASPWKQLVRPCLAAGGVGCMRCFCSESSMDYLGKKPEKERLLIRGSNGENLKALNIIDEGGKQTILIVTQPIASRLSTDLMLPENQLQEGRRKGSREWRGILSSINE
eukprot:bmy_12008T0